MVVFVLTTIVEAIEGPERHGCGHVLMKVRQRRRRKTSPVRELVDLLVVFSVPKSRGRRNAKASLLLPRLVGGGGGFPMKGGRPMNVLIDKR